MIICPSILILFLLLFLTLKMIETIGAEYIETVEDAHMATHVIASDGIVKLRRTPKLMICLCRTSQILSIEWLEQSAKEQRILDTDDFLLVTDREAEKRYDFSMKETLQNGILARRKRGGVLGGWFVYICSGVAGNKAPNMKEMHLIIEGAGGTVLKSLSKSSIFDPLKTIVLTSEPSTKAQLKERGVSKVESAGAKILSTSWLFHTIITQNLFDIDTADDDGEDEAEQEGEPRTEATNDNGSHISRLVRCNSHESLESTISVLSVSPVKRGVKRTSPSKNTNAGPDDASVRSASTRGSRVSHLERATYPPSSNIKRRKLAFDMPKPQASQKCLMTTREQCLSTNQSMLALDKPTKASEDEAAMQTHQLWLDYFNNEVSSSTSTTAKKQKKGVRGRKRKGSISPLVSATTPNNNTNEVTSAKNNTKSTNSLVTARHLTLDDNTFITWEAYVLFLLGSRAEKLGSHHSLASDRIMPADCFFPRPISINSEASSSSSNRKLSLKIDTRPSVDDDESESFEIFGTMKEVFSLHQQYQTSGMIPEKVISTLSLQMIEAVAVMHSCGVVHNDIGLDSFLVVRKASAVKKTRRKKKSEDENNSWFLQLTGFGYKAVVLNCQQQCQEAHYEHDYQCLANVIHLLLTGGIEIALHTSTSGLVEFTSKAFIKGNLFLRGALSWCSLIDSLMCIGELTSEKNSLFRLKYPLNILNVEASDTDEGGGDNRTNQLEWSIRILQELSENDDALFDFIEGLCPHQSRFVFPDIDLTTYAYTAHDDRQSFVCLTSNEGQSRSHLTQRESTLQSDTLALARRETELQEKIARFEKAKAEQQSILKRESNIRIKENELLQREREQALEVQRLKKMEEELILRERRLEQGLHSPPNVAAGAHTSQPNENAQKQKQKKRRQSPQELKFPHLSEADNGSVAPSNRPLPLHESGRKRKKPPTPSLSQLVAGEETSQGSNGKKQHRDHRLSNPIPRQKQAESSVSFKSPQSDVIKKDVDEDLLSPDLLIDSEEDEDAFHLETQESQESSSSARKRKRGSAHKSSLMHLPKSPQKINNTEKSKPKKVFINLEDE